MKQLIIVIVLFGFFACNEQTEHGTAQGDWIKGTQVEQIKTVEKQFRGFDHAMVETGYRYQELYWAGQDQNWEYAEYQLEKIKIAIANGLERRPKRAKSAQHFLTYVLPEMKKSLENKDTKIFNKNFQTMTINCNSCHAMEKVPFFSVQIPTDRQSPIKKQDVQKSHTYRPFTDHNHNSLDCWRSFFVRRYSKISISCTSRGRPI
jgi:hypothetical protein